MNVGKRLHASLMWMVRIGPIGRLKRALHRVMYRFRDLDLSGASNEQTGVPASEGCEHAATGSVDLEEAFNAFGLSGRVKSILDVGCGKGAALITFHRLGIRQLSGVELSGEILDICRKNLKAMGVSADLKHGNAMDLFDFSQFDMIYNFNSLPRQPLTVVLGNIINSVKRTNREVMILFSNFKAKDRDLLARSEISIAGEVSRTMDYILVRVSNRGGEVQ